MIRRRSACPKFLRRRPVFACLPEEILKTNKALVAEIFYGERFGRLTAQENVKGRFWSVLCDCGTVLVVRGTDLRQGKIRRCQQKSHPKIAPEESVARNMYRRYKTRAFKRGIPFDLPYGAFREMITWHCAYCGSRPSPQVGSEKSSRSHPLYNGLDQVFSSQGYTSGNTIPSCWKCNRAKSIMTQNEFIKWIKGIAENMHTSIWGSDHPVSIILAKLKQEQKRRIASIT
jgi:hypothetical protein